MHLFTFQFKEIMFFVNVFVPVCDAIRIAQKLMKGFPRYNVFCLVIIGSFRK